MTPAGVRALASIEFAVTSALLAIMTDQQSRRPLHKRITALEMVKLDARHGD